MTIGQILRAKEDEDGELDLPFLAKLIGRVGLREDPTDLPQWALDERKINASK